MSSDGDDLYPEATFIAIALLRRVYKHASVILFIDEVTERKVLPRAQPAMNAANEVIRVKADFPDSSARSRYMKTSIRLRVNGDFVFLDSDTLVIGACDKLFTGGTPIAAALDLNSIFPYPHTPIWIQPIYQHFGWTYPLKHYFNTGVVYWADLPETRRLAELWHERWRLVIQKFGKYHDQPSFNSAVADSEIAVKVLPTVYNAMVEAHPRFVRGARILHFFSSKPSMVANNVTLIGHLLRHYQLTKQIDWPVVEAASENGDAWVGPTESIQIEWARRHFRLVVPIIMRRGWRGLWRRVGKLYTVFRNGKSPSKQ